MALSIFSRVSTSGQRSFPSDFSISGVRKSDQKYTCPMLSVHTYHRSGHRADVAQDKQKVSVNEQNHRLQIEQGPKTVQRQENFLANEDVVMVPLEDIIRISFKTEIKKGSKQEAQSIITPTYEKSENCCDRCCEALCGCCCSMAGCVLCCCEENKVVPIPIDRTTMIVDDHRRRNRQSIIEDLPLPRDNNGCFSNCLNSFRCWCCRKMRLTKLIRTTEILSEEEAERMITVSIEYSMYSNLDSATNARLLSREAQEAYYRDKFQPNTTLRFYLVDNNDSNPRNFEMKREQAEALCRIVMQLKGMETNYPSESDLDKILDQPLKRTYGDLFIEPTLQLQLEANIQQSIPPTKQKAIQ